MMLVAFFAVSAVVLKFNNSVSPETFNQDYWFAKLPGNLTALWTMLVTFIATIIDLTCVPLHIIIAVTKYCRLNSHKFL